MSARDTLRSQIGAFVMLPTFVLDCCRDANAIHVYAIIARHVNRERQAWPGQERIAEQMGASLRTVQRGLDVLKAAKVLSTQPRREGGVIVGTVYTLLARPDYVPRAACSWNYGSQDVVGDEVTSHKSTRQSYTPKREGAYKEELDPQELDPKALLLTEPTADARNPVAVIFDAHDEGFRKITISAQAPNGQPPTHTGKDRGIVKHLLKTHAADRLVELLAVFFASEDPFIERSGYTLGVFASQIDKLIVDEQRVSRRKRRPASIVEDPLRAAAREERGRQFDAAIAAAIGEMTGHELVRASELIKPILQREFPNLSDENLERSVASRLERQLRDHVHGCDVAMIPAGLKTFRDCIAKGRL